MAISEVDEIIQEDSDNLADIIWWIKGYHSASEDSYGMCDFKDYHIESLRKTRILMKEHLDKKEKINGRKKERYKKGRGSH